MRGADLVGRLEGVRQVGGERWVARCPAHSDRTPSLSIAEVDDRILVHCFAGCDAADVLAAVGLSLGDLYHEPLEGGRRPLDERRRWSPEQRMIVTARARSVIEQVAAALERGEALSEEMSGELTRARRRLREAGV